MSFDNNEIDDNRTQKKDPVFSTKVSKDIHEKAYKLLEQSGLPTLKEWFETAVSVMELHQMQGTEAEQAQDSQQMKFHLSRVQELFLNQVQKVFDLKIAFDEQLANENRLHKGIVDNLQAQKSASEEERDKAVLEKDLLEKEINELRERNTELEAQHRISGQTIEIIQQRNAALEAELSVVAEIKNKFINIERERDLAIKEREDMARQLKRIKEESERKLFEQQNTLILKMEKALAEAERKLFETSEQIRKESIGRERELIDQNQKLTRLNHDLEMNLKDFTNREGELLKKIELLEQQIGVDKTKKLPKS